MPLESSLASAAHQGVADSTFLRVEGVELTLLGRTVLNGIQFRSIRGEFVRLIGPAGAGKSVLLRVIAGLQRPDRGTVLIAEADPYRLKPNAAAGLRRMLGIVLQDPLLIGEASVLANVALPAHAAGVDADEATKRALRVLQRLNVGAEDWADRAVRTLPRSQQQMVALARALVNRPALLLLDEPTAHLGAEAAATFARTLQQFTNTGVTVIVATQGHFVTTSARDVRIDIGRTA